MNNFDALKQLPLKNFASMVFNITRHVCKTEEEFAALLEREMLKDVEDVWKETLQEIQCPNEN